MTRTTLIETACVRIEWRASEPIALRVEPLRPGVAVRYKGEGEGPLREETTYTLLVQARGDTDAVAVRHADPVVTRALHPSQDGRTVHGTLATRSQVGTLRLVIEADGRPEVALVAEVIPTKVDTATVEVMRSEVEATVAGLALRYLRATTVPASVQEARTVQGGGWMRLVEAALDRLEPALAEVARAPHRDTKRAVQPQPSATIRRPDAAVRRALTTRGGLDDAVLIPIGTRSIPVPRMVPSARATTALDTPEHRWLRVGLEQGRRRLEALRAGEARTSGPRRETHLAALDTATTRVRSLLRLDPLAAATLGPPSAPTLRLRRTRGYREAYAAVRLLRFGLDLGAGRLATSLIDLAALYEVWTYLTVAQTVAEVVGQPLDAARFFSAEAYGLRLRLRRGTPHALRFPLDGGGAARLAYQPHFGRPALLPQRPDLLLTVARPGVPLRRYVLDAKYRRDDSAATVRRYGLPAPPADALADLHRYRDAIRDAAGQRIIDQAIALYPFMPENDAQVEASRLWQSIGTLGVGAIPLAPGHTDAVRAWLRSVLAR